MRSNIISCILLLRRVEYVNTSLYLCVRNRSHYTLYNSVLAKQKQLQNIQRHQERRNKARQQKSPLNKDSLPVSLKYYSKTNVEDSPDIVTQTHHISKDPEEPSTVKFPFQDNVQMNVPIEKFNKESKSEYEIMQLKNEFWKEKRNWMINYDNFDDTLLSEDSIKHDSINYGTPDPKSEISKVPCGGCGALLHCKDPFLPGYIPSEIFKNAFQDGCSALTAIICQRCYFLKNHNIALEVQVSNEDYPKVLQTISANTNALVVLMIDLTDFPCSIWPGIADIFHKKPIIVVGNKVDLLPADGQAYLNHLQKKLFEIIKAYGFAATRLIDVVLISATTGYGVEKLITKLHKAWKYKGDVYIVGCTNVGKSSLFNTLIKSDYCKSQAEDLIQRATTSIWPGTTLNLLKFPISKPSGHKLEVRQKRLRELERLERHELSMKKDLLRGTKNWKHAILMGRIDRSHLRSGEGEQLNSFLVRPSDKASGRHQLGVNENDFVFAHSRWCYDTPGVVQPDQIIHLLTTEELYFTLPKRIIVPRTFCVKPGESLFIGGLARLDFLEGDSYVRLTVFSSKELPISLCKTEEALEFYNKYLGTEYLRVPAGGSERLKRWPGLSGSKTFTVKGIDVDYSAKDIVLSNAGWMSITPLKENICKFKAWTPEKRGVHLRDCMLPRAVNLRGPRIQSSPAYKIHRYFNELCDDDAVEEHRLQDIE